MSVIAMCEWCGSWWEADGAVETFRDGDGISHEVVGAVEEQWKCPNCPACVGDVSLVLNTSLDPAKEIQHASSDG